MPKLSWLSKWLNIGTGSNCRPTTARLNSGFILVDNLSPGANKCEVFDWHFNTMQLSKGNVIWYRINGGRIWYDIVIWWVIKMLLCKCEGY